MATIEVPQKYENRIIGGLAFLRELAEALGLDPKTLPICGISIDCKVKDIPVVTVEMRVFEKQAREILNLVQKYSLVPIDGEVTKEPPS